MISPIVNDVFTQFLEMKSISLISTSTNDLLGRWWNGVHIYYRFKYLEINTYNDLNKIIWSFKYLNIF